MKIYIEHEQDPDFKIAIHEMEPYQYMVQLIDGQELFYQSELVNADEAQKIGKGYGFDCPSPLRNSNFIEKQWVGW